MQPSVIALDSSVLLDVLVGDPRHVDASEEAIAGALAMGEVVVCEAVVAELQSLLDTDADVMEVLESMGIRFQPGSEQVAMRAGLMNKRFRKRGGQRERVMADFLIGAHAMLQCKALITRDDAFFRVYFKGLRIIAPRA